MYAERHDIALTTDADGNCTAYTIPVTGKIATIIYAKTDFADGVDVTITTENSGEPILAVENLNASTTYSLDTVIACDDRVKIVVANGGDTKTGLVRVVVA